MKKPKLPFSLSISVLLITSFIGATSVKVNAGSNPAIGTTPDSSSISGDSFSPAEQTATPKPSSNANVDVNDNGQITISPVSQSRINARGFVVIQRSQAAGIPEVSKIVVSIAVSGRSANTAFTRVSASISATGVSPVFTAALLENFASLLAGFPLSSVPNGSVAFQRFTTGNVLAQNTGIPNVDINRLNAAIEVYNQIIRKSDIRTLRRLLQNAEFVEIGNVLRELRAGLNK